jgi:hypothetical protein
LGHDSIVDDNWKWNLLFMRKKDMINREQRSAEPRRSRSCFDYYERCRTDIGVFSDQIYNFTKAVWSHPDLRASCLYSINYWFVSENQIHFTQYCIQMIPNPWEMADGLLEVR